MFQQLFSSESACRRHGDAPFSDERERYLQHCAEQGSTRATLRVKANELLWLAQHLESNASDGVNIEALQDIVRERQSVCQGATTARRLVDIARPWLRFLGWWRAPVAEFRFQNELTPGARCKKSCASVPAVNGPKTLQNQQGFSRFGRPKSAPIVHRKHAGTVPLPHRCRAASATRAGMRSPGRCPGTKRQQFEAAWASYCEPSATPPQASKFRYLSRP